MGVAREGSRGVAVPIVDFFNEKTVFVGTYGLLYPPFNQ